MKCREIVCYFSLFLGAFFHFSIFKRAVSDVNDIKWLPLNVNGKCRQEIHAKK